MIYPYLRYGLIALFLGLGLLLHLQLGLAQAWYLYLAGLLLLLSHLLFGSVWLAFSFLKRGRPEVADKLLRQVWNPDWLIRRNRAYYYFTLGMLHLQYKRLQDGEKHLRQAVELGLQRPNDNALAYLNLAHIYYVEAQAGKAREAMKKARSFNPTDLMIKDKLEKLGKALAAQN